MFTKSSRAVLRLKAIPDLQEREGDSGWWLCSLQPGQGSGGSRSMEGKGLLSCLTPGTHQLFLGNHFSQNSQCLLNLMNRAGN